MQARKTCGAADGGFGRCGRKVDPLARMGLCDIHILNAYDYLCGKIGMTDVLPWPCQACGSRLGVRYPSGWLCAVCEWRLGQPVDEELLPPRVDVVYYLRFRDRVKIGTSSNPRMRLSQIRYEKLLAFERGDRATEQKRHEQFAKWRFVGSEWFHQNDALDAHIAALAAGVEDPWNLYARWRSEAIALRV